MARSLPSKGHCMSRRLLTSLVPTVFGVLVLGAGCTFEPPGDVTGNTGGNNNPGGADGGADPGGDDGAPPVEGDPETMTITFTSSPNGGAYAPTNIVATWIEDAQGNHVKTIDRQAGVRVQHLVAWNQKAGANQDAVSGATRANHNTPVTAIWDVAAAALPDGIYTIRIESADDNSGTPDQNRQGTFTFEKNGTASVQNVAGDGFTDVVIDYSGRVE